MSRALAAPPTTFAPAPPLEGKEEGTVSMEAAATAAAAAAAPAPVLQPNALLPPRAAFPLGMPELAPGHLRRLKLVDGLGGHPVKYDVLTCPER